MSSESFFLIFIGIGILVAFLVLRERWTGRAQRSKESPYLRGLSALIDGDDREALDLLKDAVQDDSNNVDAYVRLGDIYRRNRKPEHAYQIHRGLLVRSGFAPAVRARVLESLVEDLLDLEKRARAREVLDELMEIETGGAQRERIARLAERAGEWETAFAVRRDAWKDAKGEARAEKRLALYRTWTACQKMRDDADGDVREWLRDALKVDSACVPAHLALGDIHYVRSELDDAIHQWRRIVDQSPRLAFLTFERLERAFFDRGTLGRGTLGDLEAIYDRLLRDHPDDTTTLEALGNLHHKRGELGEAINVCQKALEISPRSRTLRRRLVLLLHEAGRIRESERELQELLQVLSDGAEDAVARAREAAAYHPIWECSDFDDWNVFSAAFEPAAEKMRGRRR